MRAPQALDGPARPGREMAPTLPSESMAMCGKEKNTYRSFPSWVGAWLKPARNPAALLDVSAPKQSGGSRPVYNSEIYAGVNQRGLQDSGFVRSAQ